MALAQQSPDADRSVSLSKVERKNKAPVSKELIKVKLPRPVEAKLDNGLTVLIIENHKLPYISMELMLDGAGPISEPSGQTGLAAATASMLTQGTATRSSTLESPSRSIVLAPDFTRGRCSAGTRRSCPDRVLVETMDKWFPVFVDVLLHPTFPEKELKNYQQRSMVDLKRQRSSPGFLASADVSTRRGVWQVPGVEGLRDA